MPSSSKTVFVVMHEHETSEGDEQTKFIGVYSSAESAAAAVGRLAAQPGFKESTEGFSITEEELDRDHWTEGFISWREALDDAPEQ